MDVHCGGCLNRIEVVQLGFAGDPLAALGSVGCFAHPRVGVIASLIQESGVPHHFSLGCAVVEAIYDAFRFFSKKNFSFGFTLGSIHENLLYRKDICSYIFVINMKMQKGPL